VTTFLNPVGKWAPLELNNRDVSYGCPFPGCQAPRGSRELEVRVKPDSTEAERCAVRVLAAFYNVRGCKEHYTAIWAAILDFAQLYAADEARPVLSRSPRSLTRQLAQDSAPQLTKLLGAWYKIPVTYESWVHKSVKALRSNLVALVLQARELGVQIPLDLVEKRAPVDSPLWFEDLRRIRTRVRTSDSAGPREAKTSGVSLPATSSSSTESAGRAPPPRSRKPGGLVVGLEPESPSEPKRAGSAAGGPEAKTTPPAKKPQVPRPVARALQGKQRREAKQPAAATPPAPLGSTGPKVVAKMGRPTVIPQAFPTHWFEYPQDLKGLTRA
jgi:hypothetical protein